MVLYVFHPRFASAVQGMPHDLLVYHPYDLFRRMPGWTPALAEQERWLLQHADRVIATSRSTRDLLALETSHPRSGCPTAWTRRSLRREHRAQSPTLSVSPDRASVMWGA